MVTNPKILGVTFDSNFTFSTHAILFGNRVKARNNPLKPIFGSTWGKEKETLRTTYICI